MKYRNENPIDKLHEGEVYFFLRSQDKLAPKAVDFYAEMLKASGDDEGYLDCLNMANRMREWQLKNLDKVKNPD